MKRLIWSLLFFLVPLTALADGDEVTRAKNQVTRQAQLIDSISYVTERSDLPRLSVLRKSSERVLASIVARGLGHAETFREYLNHMLTYKFSEEYLNSIKTDASELAIRELWSIHLRIIADRGFEEPPLPRITYNVFCQIRDNLQLLKQQPIPESLKTKIDDLNPGFGNLLALAQQGDRPSQELIDAAQRMFGAVKSLYADLDAISGSGPAFDLSLTIRGLNEFYAEYADLR